VLYLLDADALIRADSTYYPLKRFPIFWTWLIYSSNRGQIKLPQEQYDEVVVGRGELVEWLRVKENKESLLLPGAVDGDFVTKATHEGYAPDLTEAELVTVGQDPFLVAYALVAIKDRTIVSFENSAPSKQRANRKLPDVCNGFGVKCMTLFELIRELDFTTNWTPPSQ
jgi:hypothetical protein